MCSSLRRKNGQNKIGLSIEYSKVNTFGYVDVVFNYLDKVMGV